MDDRVYIRWRSFEEVEVDMTDRMAMVKNEWRRENYLDDKGHFLADSRDRASEGGKY